MLKHSMKAAAGISAVYAGVGNADQTHLKTAYSEALDEVLRSCQTTGLQ